MHVCCPTLWLIGHHSKTVLVQQSLGVRKEPDWAAFPQTRMANGSIPSIVLEVGVSPSWEDLQNDAKEWLSNFNHEVSLAWPPCYPILIRLPLQVLTVILLKAWNESVQMVVWKRDQLGIPKEDFRDTYTLNNVGSIPDLMLRDVDLFLPHEIPGAILNRQVRVLGPRLGFMVQQMISLL